MATIQNSPLGRSCTQRLQGTQLVDARSEDGREADLFCNGEHEGKTWRKRRENHGKPPKVALLSIEVFKSQLCDPAIGEQRSRRSNHQATKKRCQRLDYTLIHNVIMFHGNTFTTKL